MKEIAELRTTQLFGKSETKKLKPGEVVVLDNTPFIGRDVIYTTKGSDGEIYEHRTSNFWIFTDARVRRLDEGEPHPINPVRNALKLRRVQAVRSSDA